MAYVLLAVQLTVAGTLLLAGMAKLRRLAETRATLSFLAAQVGIRSRAASNTGVWMLIMAEIFVAVAILGRWWVGDIGLVLASVLLLAFSGGAIISAIGTVRVTCTCFGHTSTVMGWRHVVRNTLLLAMTVVVLASPQATVVDPGGLAVSILAAVILTAIVVSSDAIFDFIAPPSTRSQP